MMDRSVFNFYAMTDFTQSFMTAARCNEIIKEGLQNTRNLKNQKGQHKNVVVMIGNDRQ
jgi:hypothetical protein